MSGWVVTLGMIAMLCAAIVSAIVSMKVVSAYMTVPAIVWSFLLLLVELTRVAVAPRGERKITALHLVLPVIWLSMFVHAYRFPTP